MIALGWQPWCGSLGVPVGFSLDSQKSDCYDKTDDLINRTQLTTWSLLSSIVFQYNQML